MHMNKTNQARLLASLICFIAISLLYDIHFVDEALAVTKLVDNEKHVADINVDTTLQVVVEVDVAAERLPVTVECKADELAA